MRAAFHQFELVSAPDTIDDADLYKRPIVDLLLAALVRPSFLACERTRPRLNNDDILKLRARFLSPRVIVRIIEVSDSDFDTSARSLVNLRSCGVSGSIVEAMLRKQCRKAI
jgi:hypothetical protein